MDKTKFKYWNICWFILYILY